MRNEAGLLEDALAARPALLSVSFGTEWSWVGKAHDAGIVTVTQVYDGAGARRAADAGVDVVVRAGPRAAVTAMCSSRRCRCSTTLDVVSVPVPLVAASLGPQPGRGAGRRRQRGVGRYAAGGVPRGATGDGSRRALIAARQPTPRHPGLRRRQGPPWPARFPSRVLANDFVARWTGQEEALARDRPAGAELAASIAADDRRIAPVDAGQGVGMIRTTRLSARSSRRCAAGAEQFCCPPGGLAGLDRAQVARR